MVVNSELLGLLATLSFMTEVFGGGWGVVVKTLTELDAALQKAKTNRGLSLIDLRIPQDSITLQMLQQAGVTPEEVGLPAKKAQRPRSTKSITA